MRYLLDTGILLRLLNRSADQHAETRAVARRGAATPATGS